MKKVIVLCITIATLLATMAGCGKELQPIEKAQAKAVEIGEQFLNYEITGAEARELLNSIKVPESEAEHGQLYLEVDIAALAFSIGKQDSTYEEIEDKVEFIKNRDYTK